MLSKPDFEHYIKSCTVTLNYNTTVKIADYHLIANWKHCLVDEQDETKKCHVDSVKLD